MLIVLSNVDTVFSILNPILAHFEKYHLQNFNSIMN